MIMWCLGAGRIHIIFETFPTICYTKTFTRSYSNLNYTPSQCDQFQVTVREASFGDDDLLVVTYHVPVPSPHCILPNTTSLQHL